MPQNRIRRKVNLAGNDIFTIGVPRNVFADFYHASMTAR